VDLAELIAREAIRETVAQYAHAADRGRFDDLVDLFAEDGVLEIAHEDRIVGRDALRAFFTGVGDSLVDTTSSRMIRHHVSNLTVDVESPTAARGQCYFLATTEHGVDHWGRYRDLYVPLGERWVFSHRYVKTDGHTPGSWAERR
jgi:ketosteroid isomerase-like protein